MSKRNTDPRIAEITGQKPEFFVYLEPGYQYKGAHCFGEDTLADIRSTMKMVKPCRCDECAALLKATP